MSEKIASAYLKSVKSSPLKVMKVANAVRNMPVSRALDVLKFSKLKLAPILRDLIYSAMSNAENNHNLDVDNLYIQKIDIGRAFALKRFHTRGRGKSSRIVKTFSNIRVVVAEAEDEDSAKKDKKSAPKAKEAKKSAPKKEAKKEVKTENKAQPKAEEKSAPKEQAENKDQKSKEQ